MSFWDNFAVKASIFCDNIRETKIGAKILDDVAESLDHKLDKINRFEEQLNLLFIEDVEKEGKERGYTKAAAEYEKVYLEVETEYRKTIQLLSNQKFSEDEKFTSLVQQLQQLEEKRKNLEQKFRRDVNYAAVRHGIPNTRIMAAFSDTGLHGNLYGGSLMDLLCSGKEKKLKKAEAKGYQEAKALFLEKLNMEQAKMDAEVSAAQGKLSDAADHVKRALQAIAEEKAKIAELYIVLGA